MASVARNVGLRLARWWTHFTAFILELPGASTLARQCPLWVGPSLISSPSISILANQNLSFLPTCLHGGSKVFSAIFKPRTSALRVPTSMLGLNSSLRWSPAYLTSPLECATCTSHITLTFFLTVLEYLSIPRFPFVLFFLSQGLGIFQNSYECPL